MDYFTILILIFLGISVAFSIVRLIISLLFPSKPEDVKGCYVKGHYDVHVVGSTVCQIWHSDE